MKRFIIDEDFIKLKHDEGNQSDPTHVLSELDFFNYELVPVSKLQFGKKYYFIYRVLGYPSHDLSQNLLPIPSSILKSIKNGYDIDIIFATFHESDSRDSLKIIQNYCIANKIDETKVHIFNGNSTLDELKKEYNVKLNVYSNNLIPRSMSRQMDLDGNHTLDTDRSFKFQCFNRNFKNHRIAILAFLHYSNIIEETDWSSKYGSRLFDFYDHPSNKFWFFNKSDEHGDILSDEWNEKLQSSFLYLAEQGDRKPATETFIFDQGGPQHDLSYKNNIFREAYINIVTETQYYWDNVTHITEKTLQPLWFYQLPIIVATPYHIKKTKELYDLDFFDDIIDHSYDLETNHQKRLEMIFSEIERLSKFDREYFRKFFEEKSTKKRLYENRNKIKLIQFSENDTNFFKQLK